MTAKEFISKHLGKTYKNEWDEEVMIVGISNKNGVEGILNKDIIIGLYTDDGWINISDGDEIKIYSPLIKSYQYLYQCELDAIDALLHDC